MIASYDPELGLWAVSDAEGYVIFHFCSRAGAQAYIARKAA